MTQATLPFEAAKSRTWDAVVLGSGPAGALAARQLALAGASVLLVDKKAFPRGKVCGACLNGQALGVLDSVGLGSLVDRNGGIDLEEYHVRRAGRAVRLPLTFLGKALSRSRFDNALVDEAVAAGAQFLPETHASIEAAKTSARLVRLESHRQSATVEARVVLAAAGLGNTCLEADPRIKTRVSSHSRIGAGCVVDSENDHDVYNQRSIHMAIGRRGYVGLVRLEDGRLNVAAAFDKKFLKTWDTPAKAAAAVLFEAGFPAVDGLSAASWQGTVPLTRTTRPLAGPRLFIIGDAAGYVEPFTGEGMGWALTSGEAVAPLALQGIARWEPSLEREWAKLHRRLVGRRMRLCRALATALHRPWIARAVFEAATRTPALSSMILRHANTPYFSYK